MSNNVILSSVLAVATLVAGLSSAWANDIPAQQNDNDRLMIVNGNSHRVIYDDGRNDLFCVTRRYVAGYDDYGYAVHRRSMRCR